MTSDPLRVLIADDHPVFRSGLRLLLESQLGAAVTDVSSGLEAVAQAETLLPDVVIMDLQMPGLSGIESTRRISETSPQVAVLVLTMFEDDDSVFAAMRAGARGYLLKGANPDEVVDAVRSVARGEAIFGPAVAERVIGFFSDPRPPSPFPQLTDREREILELVARGWSNERIASHFVLSQKTVRNHVSNIFAKLRVADRAQAIVRAREAGLGRTPQSG
jgi:DNA-binding NarL/FixJ family response regulator